MAAIPQLDGNSNKSGTGSVMASQPPMPPPSTMPPPPMLTLPPPMLPPPADQILKKKSYCNGNSNDIFNFDLRKCIACLKQMINAKCQSTTSEYDYKYRFKYAIEYCEIMCKT
jgi:hypothetical protein